MAIFLSTRFLNNYNKVQLNNCTIYIRKDLHNHTLEEALSLGQKALSEKYNLISIRSSEFAHVFKFGVEFSGCTRQIFYKEYLCRSIWDFIKHIFRPSRANRSFRAGLMLQEKGFDVPEVTAFGEASVFFVCRKNFLLTMEIEDAQQLSTHLSNCCQDLKKEGLKNKRQLIQAFGQTIGRLHSEGIFHGDLRLGNIMVKQSKSGWIFFFLDNERTRYFVKLPDRLRLKNLVQVNMFRKGISNSDRLRFLKAYLGENPIIVPVRRHWAKNIIDKTNRRLRNKDNLLML